MVAIPLSAPNFSPAIGQAYFESVWSAYFDSLTDTLNAAAPLADPTFTGTVTMSNLTVAGDTQFGSNIGFYGATPAAKPTVSGSRGSNLGFVVTTLITALADLGLITDATTA